MDMAIETIRRGFGVTVRARTLRRWLRRIGFSWRKDRYVPYRSVSKERQEGFKREAGERAAQRRADGMTVFAEDEASAQMGQNPAYGWGRAGGCEETRTSFSRRAVRIFGAMSEDELRIKVVARQTRRRSGNFWGRYAGTARSSMWFLTTRPTTSRRRQGVRGVRRGRRRAGVSPALHSAAEPCRDRVEGPEEEACRQVPPAARRAEGGDDCNPWARGGQQAQRLPRRLSWAAWKTAISYRNGVRQPRVPSYILEKLQGNANNIRGGPVYSCIFRQNERIVLASTMRFTCAPTTQRLSESW